MKIRPPFSLARRSRPNKTLVALCVCTRDGDVRGEIADLTARLGTLSLDPTHPYDYTFVRVAGREPVSAARNFLVGQFMDYRSPDGRRAEWLQFVDADQGPPMHGFAQLYRRGWEFTNLRDEAEVVRGEADVASGLTWMWRPDAPPGRRMLLNQSRLDEESRAYYPVMPPGWESGLCYEVDTVGTALMAIRRQVVEACGAPNPFRERYGDDGSVVTGEDVAFCLAARAQGRRVLIDSSALADHFKKVSLLAVAREMQIVMTGAAASVRRSLLERMSCGHRRACVAEDGRCEVCGATAGEAPRRDDPWRQETLA